VVEKASIASERFATLVGETAADPDVVVGSSGRGFGSGALTLNGRIAAMVSHDRLVLKLPAARVAELIATGRGSTFDAGKGKPLREWLVVDDDADWRGLADEAIAFGRGARGR
jgi:hypothetical protein